MRDEIQAARGPVIGVFKPPACDHPAHPPLVAAQQHPAAPSAAGKEATAGPAERKFAAPDRPPNPAHRREIEHVVIRECERMAPDRDHEARVRAARGREHPARAPHELPAAAHDQMAAPEHVPSPTARRPHRAARRRAADPDTTHGAAPGDPVLDRAEHPARNDRDRSRKANRRALRAPGSPTVSGRRQRTGSQHAADDHHHNERRSATAHTTDTGRSGPEVRAPVPSRAGSRWSSPPRSSQRACASRPRGRAVPLERVGYRNSSASVLGSLTGSSSSSRSSSIDGSSIKIR